MANDSTSSALYKNNHDGTFQEIAIEAGVAYSADGKPQAGMGVSVADYDGDGNFDLVKTNFAGDTTSLYRNLGGGVFEDQTFQAGLGKITRFLGWGVAFVDYDNDGWPDIVQCNGHVYPEVGETLDGIGIPAAEAGVPQSAERQVSGGLGADGAGNSGEGDGARDGGRRFRQRRRSGSAGELRQRRAATAALRFGG